MTMSILTNNLIFQAIAAYVIAFVISEIFGYLVFKFFVNKLFLSDGENLTQNSTTEEIKENIVENEDGTEKTKTINTTKITTIPNNSKLDRSLIKGIIERIFLSLSMINLIYPLLTVYGALKIGTRLGNSHQVKNDYFLIGNVVSILIAMLSYAIFRFLIPLPNN